MDKRRPIAVTIISFVLIVTGAFGLILHPVHWQAQNPFESDILGTSLVSLAAIVSGAYMLRAGNWARWLSLAWIGFHVILSIFHSRFELMVHILIFAAFAYFLFRRGSSEYFRASTGHNGAGVTD